MTGKNIPETEITRNDWDKLGKPKTQNLMKEKSKQQGDLLFNIFLNRKRISMKKSDIYPFLDDRVFYAVPPLRRFLYLTYT